MPATVSPELFTMRSLKRVACVTAALGLLSVLPGLQTEICAQNQILVWAPQPLQPNPWISPNKPVTRLSELRARHSSEQNWTETVVSDNLGARRRGDFIRTIAPGGSFRTDKSASRSKGRSRLSRQRDSLFRFHTATSIAWRRWETNHHCGSK
jgi:hypothetical protein